jgi:taurine dioxygenase
MMSKLEHAVPGYKYLSIEPYTPNIGAIVHDVDLAKIADEGPRAELRKALAEFQVLFFRKQTLTPEQQVDVAKIFGDPDKAKAFFPRHTTQKAIELIEAKPSGHRYGTDQWHADITFSPNPPTGTVLYAHVIPASGGDTLWASATAVYDSLPKSLQLYLEELEATHSFGHSGWPDYFAQLENGEAIYRKARADYLPVVHPVVRVHPVTGKKLVYVNPNFTDRIKGLSRQQSDALLTFLFAQFQRPEFQARLIWEQHTVAIWDNRATVHYATADYGNQHRLLHRVTFGEDRAF